MTSAFGALAFSMLALVLGGSEVQASLIYLYDFPGSPGSGLAANQTNPQPSDATFSDFTRNNVGVVGSSTDEFGSNNWSLGGVLDSTVFEGFSITSAGGFHLNLSSLTFSAYRSATGPQNMEVALFLNGSASAYATFDFSPTTSKTPYTFNFTPLTDSDNVTTATFKFYGWNAGGAGGQLYLDDVATNGTISSLPEVAPLLPVTLIIACSVVEIHRRRARDPRVRNKQSRGLGLIGLR